LLEDVDARVPNTNFLPLLAVSTQTDFGVDSIQIAIGTKYTAGFAGNTHQGVDLAVYALHLADVHLHCEAET